MSVGLPNNPYVAIPPPPDDGAPAAKPKDAATPAAAPTEAAPAHDAAPVDGPASPGDAAAVTAPPTDGPWANTPEQVQSNVALANDLAFAIDEAQAQAAATGETIEIPKEVEEFVKVWAKPIGLDGDNRMLRFLYLDDQLGWVFKIPNDSWWTGRQTTDLEDAGPAHELAEARRHANTAKRSRPAGLPLLEGIDPGAMLTGTAAKKPSSI